MGGNAGEEFDRRLRQSNLQLNRCRLRVKGDRLFIRARFPPRPGEDEPIRTDLATGCYATVAGLKAALIKAQAVDADLTYDRFDWMPWLRGKRKHLKPAETIGEWVKAFEGDYWKTRQRTVNSENTYYKDLGYFFKQLPQDDAISVSVLEDCLLARYPLVGKRGRQMCANAFARLAEFARLEPEAVKILRSLGKGYSPSMVDPRSLPSDDEILDVWNLIKEPGWRFVLSLLAIYGLRPHEVFSLHLNRLSEDPPVLEVQEETKTGRRIVFPCFGEGWEPIRASLQCPSFPRIRREGRSNSALGLAVAEYLRTHGSPFSPMDYRHAYARRLYLAGFDSRFAAKSMGHSREVHERIYSAWWGEEPFMERYQEVMRRKLGGDSSEL
jgi:integrase